MLETGTSGLMSGEGKRVGDQSVSIPRPSSTLRPGHNTWVQEALANAHVSAFEKGVLILESSD